MTDGSQTTLGAFFLPVGYGRGLEPWLDPLLSPLVVAASGLGRRIPWDVVRKEVAARVGELLDIDVADVVATAWEKAEEFREYADPELHSPDETVVTELAEHEIEVEFHPSLEVLIDERALPGIQLDVELSLTLKGLILKIRDGKVREMKTGTVTGAGKVAAAGLVILEKETSPIPIPGTREFSVEEPA